MIEYRTTDTNELAPYSGMTSDDLCDFETFCDDIERSTNSLRSGLIYGGCLWLVIVALLWLT